MNGILLSALFFFLAIWAGTQAGVKKVQTLLTNYLWSGSTSRSRSKVAWYQCCLPHGHGGINLIDPVDAVNALLIKWVIKACKPGQSNLHATLRFRLASCQPYQGRNWAASLEFFTSPGHSSKKGSLTWNRVTTAWKTFVKSLNCVLPRSFEEACNESLWWSPEL
jgi:hypothetical protein